MARTLTKRDRIVGLLETYTLAACPLEESSDGDVVSSGESGSVEHRMSDEWKRGSYPKLERLLLVLREKRPDLHWHVVARYVTSETLPQDVVRHVGQSVSGDVVPIGPRGENVGPGYGPIGGGRKRVRRLAVRHDPRVDMRLVDEGVDLLVSFWAGDVHNPPGGELDRSGKSKEGEVWV